MLADLSSIGNFLGYGNPRAVLWFVGGEEGFGGRMTEAERLESLQTRASWSSIRDMHEAHLELREAGSPIDISKPPKGSIAVWLWMARFYLTLSGRPYAESNKLARDYVFHRLGRTFGDMFLTEVSPFPCVRARSPHPLIEKEAREANPGRAAKLRGLQEETNPLIICYGIGRKDEFGDLLDLRWRPFPGLEGKVSADPMKKAFLLPFFGQGQMSHRLAMQFCADPDVQRLAPAPL